MTQDSNGEALLYPGVVVCLFHSHVVGWVKVDVLDTEVVPRACRRRSGCVDTGLAWFFVATSTPFQRLSNAYVLGSAVRREHLYLLRIWLYGGSADHGRISVDEVRTKEVRHFAAPHAFERFVAFFQEQLAQGPDQAQDASWLQESKSRGTPMRYWKLASLGLSLLVLMACSSGPPTDEVDEEGFELVLSDEEVSVPRGGSADVTVTIEAPQGFVGDVTLSVSELPDQVSGTFDPNPATSSSTLTLEASAGAEVSSQPSIITVTASAADLTGTATLELIITDEPATLTIDLTLQPPVADIPALDEGERRPVARFESSDGQTLDFVANELYLMTDDPVELQDFLDRWNGEVLATLDFAELGVDDVAPFYLVRIDAADVDTEGVAERWSESAGLRGDNRVSSEAALQLFAAALEEAVEHQLKVGVNPLTGTQQFSERLTQEAEDAVGTAPDGSAYSPDAFTWPYMNRGSPQDIGTAEAWRVLEAMGRLGNRVRIGVADGGFRPNTDFPETWTIVPNDGLRVPNPDPTDCGSAGPPTPECVWHGAHVVMAGMGQADNEFGAAGPAGPVAELIMLQSPTVDFVGILNYIFTSVVDALSERPHIINISAGVSMPTETCLLIIIGAPVCEALHAVAGAFRAAGILVVAAAGNDGLDVDETKTFGLCPFCFEEEAELTIPCELTTVMCVGGLAWNDTTKHGQSNWGSAISSPNTVDIFGPMEVWSVADAVAADETNADPDGRAGIVTGTSFAAPYVAGVAALVWAANPGLNADQVAQIVIDTAHTDSGDARVPRWVNALGAVQESVGGNTPPWIRIVAPSDGASFPRGRTSIRFAADVEDLEGDDLTITWTSTLEAEPIGTGTSFNRIDLAFGTHTITATASDGTFSASDTISITVFNEPPTVELIEPHEGATFCADEPITFRAEGRDWNSIPTSDLEDSAFSWTSSPAGLSDTGRNVTHSFATEGSYLITVRGTDGEGSFTEESVTINVVECTDEPPVVTITVPAEDTGHQDLDFQHDGFDSDLGLYYKDVELEGEAIDPEDGVLTGDSLVWTTDRSDLQTAELGTGTALTVRLYSDECAGAWHEITLTATDSDGNARSAVRRIRIWQLC